MPTPTIRLYYGLTPIFWLVDWALGVNLRAAALAAYPFWKTLYYVFCVVCGVVIWKRPAWTSAVGLGEASLNILLLVLAVYLPYLRALDQLAGGAATVDVSPFAPTQILGLVLSGLVWVASFHLHAGGPERRPR